MTSKAGHTAGPWATYFVSGHAIQRCDRATGHVVRDVAYCDTPERASELTEAFTVAHETGLTPHQLAEQRAELLTLLKRYRNEVPLGNQPHMIAHVVDALLAKATAGGAL